MSRAVRVLVVGLAAVALSAVVAGGVAAKPSRAGPGDPSGNQPGAKACQKGGWDDLYRAASDGGSGFASEEECTSYAAQGGTLSSTPPSPYSQTKALCESYGGTFTVGEGELLWSCDGWASDNDTHNSRFFSLANRCHADAGAIGATFETYGRIGYAECLLPSS